MPSVGSFTSCDESDGLGDTGNGESGAGESGVGGEGEGRGRGERGETGGWRETRREPGDGSEGMPVTQEKRDRSRCCLVEI